jgi:hypothetical protein
MRVRETKANIPRSLQILPIASLSAGSLVALRRGFIVLFPAFSKDGVSEPSWRNVIDLVISVGAAEICAIGPFASEFHDQLDELLERRGVIEIVTTACSDEKDGVEYFVYGAGAAEADLLVLADEHQELIDAVSEEYEHHKSI